MRFLVDESTGKRFNQLLNEAGHDSVFVGDVTPGITDETILSNAESEGRILITDDKDFGELVFRLNRPSAGVILLRILTTNPEIRLRVILDLMEKHELKHRFITLTDDKIRIRKI